MRNLTNKGFTLVELLVVITILAIISVVAYQSFWWATDKAISWRKMTDVSTIETALQQYKVEKKFYPPVWEYDSSNNMWWYNSWTIANPSNTLVVKYSWNEIENILSWSWGWKIYGSWSVWQIWAKWTISREVLGRQYLSADLYDPELWDTKVSSWNIKMIDKWIWRYVYASYAKSANWWNRNLEGTNYNIAYTIKKEWSESYVTKIVWDYDETACIGNESSCPETLIWSLSWTINKVLVEWQEQWKDSSWSVLTNYWSNSSNQWIPYTVKDLSSN